MNDLLHLRHWSQSRVKLCPQFWIFSKNRWPSSPATFISRLWSAPGGKDLAPSIFYRKFINCLLKHCEICRSDISKQKNKYQKKKKKMLETKNSYSKYEKLAKKLVESPIHLAWTVLELFQLFSGRGGGGWRDRRGLKSFPGFEEGWTIKNNLVYKLTKFHKAN